MVTWFGESWGAPCCDPEDHRPTPVGEPCRECGKAIEPEAQGISMPHISLDGAAGMSHFHIDCYLKVVLPHTFDCPHCRGRDLSGHVESCAHRKGGDCDCYHTWERG